jgi:hypothetical protein
MPVASGDFDSYTVGIVEARGHRRKVTAAGQESASSSSNVPVRRFFRT